MSSPTRARRRTGAPSSSATRRNSRKPLFRKVGAALMLLAAAGLLFIAVSRMSGSEPSDTAAVTDPAKDAAWAKLARLDPNSPYALGSVDAPVVMIEYSDFQCSFCRKFAQDTEQALIGKYVDAGVLRIEWRNFPIFGEESKQAAAAGWAAGQQGRFWEFHNALYAAALPKNSGALTPDRLAEFAEQAGVPDIARFRADQASDAASKAVNTDLSEGYNLGVTSTPAFLINGRAVLGAQPTEFFLSVVESAKNEAARKAGS
ncbi:DsbA family protein [Nocardia acididurans]|uniref:DsbA family protein n=1 Tax=Nocardia acididurans TaxID=2802282 RepID=UPI0027DAB6AD|nr:DsbA family protein [Nocardia acididurans]